MKILFRLSLEFNRIPNKNILRVTLVCSIRFDFNDAPPLLRHKSWLSLIKCVERRGQTGAPTSGSPLGKRRGCTLQCIPSDSSHPSFMYLHPRDYSQLYQPFTHFLSLWLRDFFLINFCRLAVRL